jgi:BMFP domain-containing protein YqiC
MHVWTAVAEWQMQNQSPLIEDFTRLMSSLAGTMAGMGREAEQRMKEKLREIVGSDDAVSRDEFDAVKALAAETRARLEQVEAELAALRPAGTQSDPS